VTDKRAKEKRQKSMKKRHLFCQEDIGANALNFN
jgi:hypothetical protein